MKFDNFLVGRQPIFDTNGAIYAYEFLFRKAGTDEQAEILDPVTATSRVLINIFQNFGMQSLTSGRKAFINVDDNIILQDVLDVLPKENLVLEIVETTNVTPEVIARIESYYRSGYTFALDDFVFSPEYFKMFMPLFSFTSYLKVDLKENSLPKMERVEKIFKGRDVKLLAEKVETKEDFTFTKDSGFELFQGFYFERPAVIEKKSIEPAKSAILSILSKLSTGAEIDAVEREFRLQPELTIKLLKLINTCSFCLRNEITSIKHALNLIGREAMRKWLTIMLYAGKQGDVAKSTMLETALLKAHVLELMSKRVYGEKYRRQADAFFIGLLSQLDVVLGVSKEELLQTIGVGEFISSALLYKDNEIGILLDLLEATDDISRSVNTATLEKLKMNEQDISEIKFDGLNWLADQQDMYKNI